jgi:hypothetical protein
MGRKAKARFFQTPRDPSNPTVEEFTSMVELHDPTHVWSRDEAEREMGAEERRLIDRARLALGDETTVPIWNRAMRRKVVPSMLVDFLWHVRREMKSA